MDRVMKKAPPQHGRASIMSQTATVYAGNGAMGLCYKLSRMRGTALFLAAVSFILVLENGEVDAPVSAVLHESGQ